MENRFFLFASRIALLSAALIVGGQLTGCLFGWPPWLPRPQETISQERQADAGFPESTLEKRNTESQTPREQPVERKVIPSTTSIAPKGMFRASNGVTLTAGELSIKESIQVAIEPATPPATKLPDLYKPIAKPIQLTTQKTIAVDRKQPLLMAIPLPKGAPEKNIAVATLVPVEQIDHISPSAGPQWSVAHTTIDTKKKLIYFPIKKLTKEKQIFQLVQSPYHKTRTLEQAGSCKTCLLPTHPVEVVCQAFSLASASDSSTDECPDVLKNRAADVISRFAAYTESKGLKAAKIERKYPMRENADGTVTILHHVPSTIVVYLQKYHNAGATGSMEPCTIRTIGGNLSFPLNGRVSEETLTVCIRNRETTDSRFECLPSTGRTLPCEASTTASCSSISAPTAPACSRDADCTPGYRCVSGFCSAACSSDNQCGPGYTCDTTAGFCSGWCGLSQTLTGTIQHEFVHSIQRAYGVLPRWIRESTAEVSSHAKLQTLGPDYARSFRSVGEEFALFSSSDHDSGSAKGRFSILNSAHYKAQDFWAYLSRKHSVDVSLFATLYQKLIDDNVGAYGEGYTSISSILKKETNLTLSALYWEWVKNHVVEHRSNDARMYPGALCTFQEAMVLQQELQTPVTYEKNLKVIAPIPPVREKWQRCSGNPDGTSTTNKCWNKQASGGNFTEAKGRRCVSDTIHWIKADGTRETSGSISVCKYASCTRDSDCGSDMSCQSGTCSPKDSTRTLAPMSTTALPIEFKGATSAYRVLVQVKTMSPENQSAVKYRVYDDTHAGTDRCLSGSDASTRTMTIEAGTDKKAYVLISNFSFGKTVSARVEITTLPTLSITSPQANTTYTSLDRLGQFHSTPITLSASAEGFAKPTQDVEITWSYQEGPNKPSYAIQAIEKENVTTQEASQLRGLSGGIPMARCRQICNSNDFQDADLKGCTIAVTGTEVTCTYPGVTKPGQSIKFDQLPCARNLQIVATARTLTGEQVKSTTVLNCSYGALIVRAKTNQTGTVTDDGRVRTLPYGSNQGVLTIGDKMVSGRETTFRGFLTFDISRLPKDLTRVQFAEMGLWLDKREPLTSGTTLGTLFVNPVAYGTTLKASAYNLTPTAITQGSTPSVSLNDTKQTRFSIRVTDLLRTTYASDPNQVQMRMAFTKASDNDNQDDYVAFAASRPATLLWPHLRIEYIVSHDPCCAPGVATDKLPQVCQDQAAATCACTNSQQKLCCNASQASFTNWASQCVSLYQGTCNAKSACHINECNDGIDNDGDGWIDQKDIDCSNQNDPSEGKPKNIRFVKVPACSDGKDNDGDGKIDSQDPDCKDGKDDSE